RPLPARLSRARSRAACRAASAPRTRWIAGRRPRLSVRRRHPPSSAPAMPSRGRSRGDAACFSRAPSPWRTPGAMRTKNRSGAGSVSPPLPLRHHRLAAGRPPRIARRHAPPREGRSGSPRGRSSLQDVLEPVPHVGGADRDVVALAVMVTALLAREDLERLLLRRDSIEALLRDRERDLRIALAVREKERALELLHHAVEREAFELLQRLGWCRHPEDPEEMVRRHRQGWLLAARQPLEPILPRRVVVPLCAPRDACGEALLERRGARGI